MREERRDKGCGMKKERPASLIHPSSLILLTLCCNSLKLDCIVSTSKESTPLGALPTDTYANFVTVPDRPPAPVGPDPNNPPWGILAGVLAWVSSVFFLFTMNLVVVFPYLMTRYKGAGNEVLKQVLMTDKTAILLQMISVIPAHLLTLAVVWAIVTRFGRGPFWSALGLTWTRNFNFWTCAGLALMLFLVGLVLTAAFGGQETQLDQILSSSSAAKYITVVLAVGTAPLVEEVVYRGVLYSALQRAIGPIWAVVGVLLLFTFVHVPQYWPNLSVISTIGILSLFMTLVRAYTGRLRPCVVIHMVFNSLSSVLILLEPYLRQLGAGKEEKAAAFIFTRFISTLF